MAIVWGFGFIYYDNLGLYDLGEIIEFDVSFFFYDLIMVFL